MSIDGRALARKVLARAKVRAEVFGKTPRIIAIVANETPATKSYLSMKAKRAVDAGCSLEIKSFDTNVSAETLREAVLASDADAIVVQLPLPKSVDTRTVCDAIPAEKDADVLSCVAREKFEHGDTDALLPPVVLAVCEIFSKNSVVARGKKAVVIGVGFLVGAPCATWLELQGAEVTVLTVETIPEEVAAALRAADIIISGAGSPHLIKPDMLKQGVILIDAGTSESGGEIVGDADPSCANKCSLFTAVPGGIGPLVVAMLFENAVTLTCAGRRRVQ